MKNFVFLLVVVFFGSPLAKGLESGADQRLRTTFLQSAFQSGSMVVVVGDRGLVGVSRDFGTSFTASVALDDQLMLNSVQFIDENTGWAVGHGSSIVKTDDGGRTWKVQHQDLTQDRPLFGVYFLNSKIGVAVGLWSLILRTEDGGATWNSLSPVVFGGSEQFDLNIYAVFGDGKHIYAAGERGFVARSDDGGLTWEPMHVDYSGTFWTGGVNNNGDVFVAGLRGSAYVHSADHAEWVRLETQTKASITDVKFHNGDAFFSALDGVSLRIPSGGRGCEIQTRPSRVPLTGVFIGGDGQPLYLSKKGFVQ